MHYLPVKAVIVLAIIFSGLLYEPAYAYLDPGTGSYMFQLFIAGVIGGLFAVKLFWRRIVSSIKRLFTGIRNG